MSGCRSSGRVANELAYLLRPREKIGLPANSSESSPIHCTKPHSEGSGKSEDSHAIPLGLYHVVRARSAVLRFIARRL